MEDYELDEIDRVILRAVQEDARHNTNTAISDRLDVSASTVSKRIAAMEDHGVIRGYKSTVDHEKAGYPLQVLFICTAPIPERRALVEETLEIDGVVNVRELMTGRGNVHIQVVAPSSEAITQIAYDIDELGYTVTDEILMRNEYDRPWIQFEADFDDE